MRYCSCGHQILRGGVSFRSELAGDLREVKGDPIQLQHGMVNLIVNAIEAMSTSSELPRELVVSSQNPGTDQITIQVGDSGVGMDPSRLSIFSSPSSQASLTEWGWECRSAVRSSKLMGTAYRRSQIKAPVQPSGSPFGWQRAVAPLRRRSATRRLHS
jgi:nitrogen fixation/metabolism regulation signal transduction histidine kinase